jgi:hypothetical protein
MGSAMLQVIKMKILVEDNTSQARDLSEDDLPKLQVRIQCHLVFVSFADWSLPLFSFFAFIFFCLADEYPLF